MKKFPASKHLTRFLVAGALSASMAYGQDSNDEGKTQAVSVPPKAGKLHALLLKRPDPGHIFERFRNAWLEQGSIETLERFLENQIAQSAGGNMASKHLLLAFHYARQGQEDKALVQFQKALELEPGNASIWLQRAKLEASSLAYEAALNSLKQATATKPKTEDAIAIGLLQGRLLARTGKTKEALACWDALGKAHADDEDLAEDLIEVRVEEEQLESAITACRALAAKPGDPYRSMMRQLRLADLIRMSGKRDDAVKSYATCLDKSGSGSWLEREILAQIDRVYRQDDDISGLEKQLKAMITAAPQRIAIHLKLAEIHAENDNVDAAITTMLKVIELTPGERAHREQLITMLTKADRQADAQKHMDDLIAQYPDESELILRKAELVSNSEAATELPKLITRYLEKAGSTESTQLRCIQLLSRHELNSQALEQAQAARKAFPNNATLLETHTGRAFGSFDELAGKRNGGADGLMIFRKTAGNAAE